MNLIFRDYQSSDFGVLVEMVLGLYSKDDTQPTMMTEAKVALSVEQLSSASNPGRIFIFEKNGSPVGYCILNRFWSNEFSGNIFYVDELFLQQEFRGNGIGEAFFRFIEAKPENDFVAFMLETVRDNEKAIRFYQKIGFESHHNHLMFKQLEK